MKKKIYSTQFKREVVCASFECKSIKDLAEKLDIDVQHIYEWRKLFVDEILTTKSAPLKGVDLDQLTQKKDFKTIYVKGNVSDFSSIGKNKN